MYDIERSFEAHSIREALDLLKEYPEAVLISGGTDVLIRMKERKLCNAVLIHVADIPELHGISMQPDGTIVIGAATRFTPLTDDPIAREHLGALVHACSQIGSPQIRNVATIGGNVCNGAVSADSAPSLLAYDAQLVLVSEEGERTVPLREFYAGPGKTHINKGHEILKEFRILPESYRSRGAASMKFGQRNAMEIATLGCAINVQLSEDRSKLEDIRIAFGVAAPTPIRCYQTEALMKGRTIDADLIKVMHTSLLSELQPRDSWRASKRMRKQLIVTMSERTLEEAMEKGGYKHA